ncbi:MAG: glycosyltransferase family 2 protein [Deltaproteobacteria bacterium]
MKGPLHSIIVPVYQSRASLETLVRRVSSVMNGGGIHFELILVDDGSQDDSFSEIKRLSSIHPFIRGFRLSRNFGHQAAVTIGLQKCVGEIIAIIDDDLQDPPEILPHFFERLYQGADVVYGVRKKRKENLLKRAVFSSFYRIIRAVSNIYIPEDSGDFCSMRRCVVNAMLQMPDANPYLRGTRAWAGFRQVGIEYERDARFQGESGYTLSKYFALALTGILMFSHLPLRIATIIGVITSLLSFSLAFYVVISWLIKPYDVPGYLSTIVAISLLGGVQLIAIGIIGHYLGYLIDNNRRWPVAFVAETTEERES